MDTEELKLNISEALKNLEDSGDIMITTSTPNVVVNKLLKALGKDLENLLNDMECSAVINCLNVSSHDIKLDDKDFQTIIGIEKEDLKSVLDKLVRD